MRYKILFTHREIDVAFLELAYSLKDSFDVYITYHSDDIHREEGITYLPLDRIKGKLQFGVISKIRSYNKKYKFDFIFSPSSSALSNSLIATIGSKTINIGYRGTGAKVRRLDPTYYLGILNPRLRYVICETGYVKDYLKNFLKEDKLAVLTKPFSINWVSNAIENPQYPQEFRDKGLKIVTVANTKGRPYKGLTTLIEAMHIINNPDIVLAIVGNYEDSDYELAQKESEYIKFLGEKKNGVDYISGADLYVLPSYRDASPRVVREAMALSKATIVSDIDGSRELIEDKNTGLLCKAGDPIALSKAIMYMYNNKEERIQMGLNGKKRIEEVFSVKKYCDTFRTILYKLLDKN